MDATEANNLGNLRTVSADVHATSDFCLWQPGEHIACVYADDEKLPDLDVAISRVSKPLPGPNALPLMSASFAAALLSPCPCLPAKVPLSARTVSVVLSRLPSRLPLADFARSDLDCRIGVPVSLLRSCASLPEVLADEVPSRTEAACTAMLQTAISFAELAQQERGEKPPREMNGNQWLFAC